MSTRYKKICIQIMVEEIAKSAIHGLAALNIKMYSIRFTYVIRILLSKRIYLITSILAKRVCIIWAKSFGHNCFKHRMVK